MGHYVVGPTSAQNRVGKQIWVPDNPQDLEPGTGNPGTPAPQPQAPSGPSLGTSRTANTPGQGLADKIFGQTPTDYEGTFKSGYANLGQPASGYNPNVTIAGTQALADSFADRVLSKTGSLPTEDQVRQFVAQNLTSGFAQKFIQGIPKDQIDGLTDQYLQGNPDALTNPGTQTAEQKRLDGLKTQLDTIYSTGKDNLVSGYDSTVFNPAKTRAADDLAGQGMLTNPNSRYNLNVIEANRGKDLQSGLNTLESARASGQVDLGKTIEDLLQKNADRAQSSYQFNKNFNANQDATFFNQGLQRQQMDLAGQIGRAQANGQSNNGFAGAGGGALSGAASGAYVGSVVPGLGTAVGAGIGGIAGGLMGYLGSKR